MGSLTGAAAARREDAGADAAGHAGSKKGESGEAQDRAAGLHVVVETMGLALVVVLVGASRVLPLALVLVVVLVSVVSLLAHASVQRRQQRREDIHHV